MSYTSDISPAEIEKWVGEVARLTLCDVTARRATKYVSGRCVVRASRRFRPRKDPRIDEIVVTVGRPNYAEREFVADCRKAGEPFPVKKIQIRRYAK